ADAEAGRVAHLVHGNGLLITINSACVQERTEAQLLIVLHARYWKIELGISQQALGAADGKILTGDRVDLARTDGTGLKAAYRVDATDIEVLEEWIVAVTVAVSIPHFAIQHQSDVV